MGRPKKDIDAGVMFHMLKNDAPVSHVAKHLGIHRDTLYANYADIIRKGRDAQRQAWQEIMTPIMEEWIRKRRQKREAKRGKRRYRPAGLHPLFWQR